MRGQASSAAWPLLPLPEKSGDAKRISPANAAVDSTVIPATEGLRKLLMDRLKEFPIDDEDD